jgi:hypothetical protein
MTVSMASMSVAAEEGSDHSAQTKVNSNRASAIATAPAITREIMKPEKSNLIGSRQQKKSEAEDQVYGQKARALQPG